MLLHTKAHNDQPRNSLPHFPKSVAANVTVTSASMLPVIWLTCISSLQVIQCHRRQNFITSHKSSPLVTKLYLPPNPSPRGVLPVTAVLKEGSVKYRMVTVTEMTLQTQTLKGQSISLHPPHEITDCFILHSNSKAVPTSSSPRLAPRSYPRPHPIRNAAVLQNWVFFGGGGLFFHFSVPHFQSIPQVPGKLIFPMRP